ncbi:MAG: hypothetical protein ACREAA_10160 [Candidatus Polarisedimenticolia bacterium]
MIAEALPLRAVAKSNREERAPWAAAVVLCAVIDAMAGGVLLLDTALPQELELIAAMVLHAMAALLLSALLRAQPSRRWVCVAALLAVPCVGAVVAVALLGTRGRGTARIGLRRKARRRPAFRLAVARPIGDVLSPCDALDCDDEELRRAVLSSLARRSDPEAITLLRRAAGGRDLDLALSSALSLDEIAERAERHRDDPPYPAKMRHAAG